jgi:hypothetical protein
MPILFGTIASSNQQARADTGAMFALSTVTVPSGGAVEIEFTSIPNTYKHLQIRGITQQNVSTDWRGVYMNFNNDTGSNYWWQNLIGDGSNAASGSSNSQTYLSGGVASGTTGIWNPVYIDILDYASAKKKVAKIFYGAERNTTPSFMEYQTGTWNNTSAITSIKFTVNATNFTQHTQLALYGIL